MLIVQFGTSISIFLPYLLDGDAVAKIRVAVPFTPLYRERFFASIKGKLVPRPGFEPGSRAR
ncbi:MAG: hypothetical protein L7H12_00175, partial [Sulfolobales archaeon]|nr:hypothetical protein [Sulfolobales archaeon]MCG2907348.1 hypothetical protein [Sulfolobales archaeon]